MANIDPSALAVTATFGTPRVAMTAALSQAVSVALAPTANNSAAVVVSEFSHASIAEPPAPVVYPDAASPVIYTSANTGYDGDPNAAGAPALVDNAAIGDLFIRDSNDRLYKKNTASAGSWQLVDDDGVTTAAMTLHVESAGSDATADGSVSLPFATIQAALDFVPKRIKHPVVIEIGAGNFAGFSLNSFAFMKPASSAAGAYLTIKGTYVAATAATGSSSGTATSGGAGTAGVSGGTLTKTSAGWTVNNFAGKLLHTIAGTGSAQYRHIVSNTADTLTVIGTWTAPANGTTFEILDYGAVVNAAISRPATYLGAESANSQAVLIYGNTGDYSPSASTGPLIVFDGLKIAPSTGIGIVAFGGSSVLVQRSHISTGSTSVGVTAQEGTNFIFLQNLIENSSTATVASFSGAVRHTNTWFKGGGIGLSLTGTKGSNLNSNYFSGQSATGTGLLLSQGTASVQFNSNIMVGGGSTSTAVKVTSATATTTYSSVSVQGGTFSGYGTGISVVGPQFVRIDAVLGTGNTTGVAVSLGARAHVASGTTITGTTEVNIDGVASDYATMRAASPKLITNTYGTIFHE